MRCYNYGAFPAILGSLKKIQGQHVMALKIHVGFPMRFEKLSGSFDDNK